MFCQIIGSHQVHGSYCPLRNILVSIYNIYKYPNIIYIIQLDNRTSLSQGGIMYTTLTQCGMPTATFSNMFCVIYENCTKQLYHLPWPLTWHSICHTSCVVLFNIPEQNKTHNTSTIYSVVYIIKYNIFLRTDVKEALVKIWQNIVF